MEFRAGAHMGKKESQWKEATAAQKCFLKTSKRVVIFTATARSSILTTATTAAEAATATKEVDQFGCATCYNIQPKAKEKQNLRSKQRQMEILILIIFFQKETATKAFGQGRRTAATADERARKTDLGRHSQGKKGSS